MGSESLMRTPSAHRPPKRDGGDDLMAAFAISSCVGRLCRHHNLPPNHNHHLRRPLLLPASSPNHSAEMLSDIEMFFAEQDEIMNKPSETIADYLARRRQRSRVSGYEFSSSPIAISGLKAISFLQGDSWSEPCAEFQGVCPDSRVSGNVPARNAAEVSQRLPDVVRAQGDTSLEPQAHCTSLDLPIDPPRAAKKRAIDNTEVDHGASLHKKSKRNDHLPTPTGASTNRPSRPETTPAASVVMETEHHCPRIHPHYLRMKSTRAVKPASLQRPRRGRSPRLGLHRPQRLTMSVRSRSGRAALKRSATSNPECHL
ncbi:hypothetical protein C8Q74DRAFT_265766 [Fomes fomentarius]|nr:hypothetical protein C8Q74DRAFT_265766 [Fomes fomentarius]